MSGNRVVTQERLDALVEMEERYERGDTGYFAGLLGHGDYVVRTRATCIRPTLAGKTRYRTLPGSSRAIQTSWSGTRRPSPWVRWDTPAA